MCMCFCSALISYLEPAASCFVIVHVKQLVQVDVDLVEFGLSIGDHDDEIAIGVQFVQAGRDKIDR